MRVASLLLACMLVIGCDAPDLGEAPRATAEARGDAQGGAEDGGERTHDTYAAPGTCGGCHPEAQRAWSGSHHDRAMQVAGPQTVLGDFDDATFTGAGAGATVHFRTRDDRFFVEIDGPDGERAEFEVAYTFGVEPLQQFLVALSGGRLQALTVAWDTERERWFSLYPDDVIPAGNPLHWTGRLQRWNTMCADCHSTALERGYDVAAGEYEPRYVALNVSCQACHGPANDHVEWARGLDPGAPVPDTAEPKLLVHLGGGPAGAEVETCAPCHARRHAVSERAVPGEPLLDHYAPEGLRADLYHADGQIDAEVYVYGSFVQSLMHRRGVRCSDCHEPHGLGLRAEGDALCVRCHSPTPDARFPTLAKRAYDTPDHHFHSVASQGARCVSCHMPAKTYMLVDDRRDHSLRIPRPDLSVEIGTPNACTGCHAERDASWAADILAARREGAALPPHFAEALAAGRAGDADAVEQLVALIGREDAPAIARATAVSMLTPIGGVPEVARAVIAAAGDRDPMVRTAAAEALAAVDPSRGVPVLARLLGDERRAVRLEAAHTLAGLPLEGLTAAQREAFGTALDEYRAVQLALGDTAEAHLNLGVVDLRRGRTARAEEAYRTAIRLQPEFVPARVNLANLLNGQGRNDEAEKQLRAALAASHELAADFEDDPHVRSERGELHYSLALLLAESGRLEDAEKSLAQSAELLPGRARIRYNRALALQQLGRRSEALASLLAAERLSPNDPDIQNALAIFYIQAGNRTLALRHGERLLEITGGSQPARELLEHVRGLPLEAPSGSPGTAPR